MFQVDATITSWLIIQIKKSNMIQDKRMDRGTDERTDGRTNHQTYNALYF